MRELPVVSLPIALDVFDFFNAVGLTQATLERTRVILRRKKIQQAIQKTRKHHNQSNLEYG